jgi:hypothetical protein
VLGVEVAGTWWYLLDAVSASSVCYLVLLVVIDGFQRNLAELRFDLGVLIIDMRIFVLVPWSDRLFAVRVELIPLQHT